MFGTEVAMPGRGRWYPFQIASWRQRR